MGASADRTPRRGAGAAAALLATVGVLTAACPAPNMSPSFTILHSPPPTPNQLSQQVALIADSHAHYLYGAPTVIQTNVADWFSASAIRPPQADLWGWRFLRWTLSAIHRDVPIIHLGDVGDISCAAEFGRFSDEMTRVQGRKRWVYTPGNHDGFFYGNYYGAKDSTSLWGKACSGSVPLDKTGVVVAYLDALEAEGEVADPDPGLKEFADHLRAHAKGPFRYRRLGNEYAFFQRAEWSLDDSARWRSWVAQEVDLSWSEGPNQPPRRRVYAILVDSAAYSKAPELIPLNEVPILGTVFAPNAGLQGEIPSAEIATISAWLADAAKEDAIVFLVAHHPFSALSDCSRKALGSLRAKYSERLILYASAHDHNGKWIVDSDGSTQWLELNVGSLLDAPMEFRYLQLLGSAKPPDRIGVYSPLIRLSDQWRQMTSPSAPHCDDHVEWEPVDAAFPIGYKNVAVADVGKTEDEILRVLLASLRQEVHTIPSVDPQASWPDAPNSPQFGGDAAVEEAISTVMTSGTRAQKIALIQTLSPRISARFSDEQSADGKGLRTRDYEMCQVMWGTKYERAGARKPGVDDTTVLLPPEKP
jgi:hypothetical protein